MSFDPFMLAAIIGSAVWFDRRIRRLDKRLRQFENGRKE